MTRISGRQYRASLDFDIDNGKISPAQRREREAYSQLAVDHGNAIIANRRKFYTDRFSDALADMKNATRLLPALAEEVRSGRIDPIEARRYVQQQLANIDAAERSVAQFREQIAVLAEADPLEVFDKQMAAFPALEARWPLPPEALGQIADLFR